MSLEMEKDEDFDFVASMIEEEGFKKDSKPQTSLEKHTEEIAVVTQSIQVDGKDLNEQKPTVSNFDKVASSLPLDRRAEFWEIIAKNDINEDDPFFNSLLAVTGFTASVFAKHPETVDNLLFEMEKASKKHVAESKKAMNESTKELKKVLDDCIKEIKQVKESIVSDIQVETGKQLDIVKGSTEVLKKQVDGAKVKIREVTTDIIGEVLPKLNEKYLQKLVDSANDTGLNRIVSKTIYTIFVAVVSILLSGTVKNIFTSLF